MYSLKKKEGKEKDLYTSQRGVTEGTRKLLVVMSVIKILVMI